jgi:hypothetical protein
MYLNLHAYSGLTPCGTSRFDFFEAFQSHKKPNIEMQKFAQCAQEILAYKTYEKYMHKSKIRL